VLPDGTGCPQAYHGGVSDFMADEMKISFLIECVRPEKHTSHHTNRKKDLRWTGKLTTQEMARVQALRAVGASLDGLA
jgi:hypothetical protein